MKTFVQQSLVVYHGDSPHMTYVRLENKEGVLRLVQQGLETNPLLGKIAGDRIELQGTRESDAWGKGPLDFAGKISGENKDQVVGKWTWRVHGKEMQSGEFKILPGKRRFVAPKTRDKF